MKWKHVWLIFRKELLETMRDRRTMIGLVILPVLLMPLTALGLPLLMQNRMDKVEESLPCVGVIGAEYGTELVTWLEKSELFALASSSDPLGDLERGQLQVVLTIPADFKAAMANEKEMALQLHYDAANEKSSVAARKMQETLNAYALNEVQLRLAQRGVDTAILTPFVTEAINIAPEEKMGNMLLSLLLPMIVGVWSALGGMYTAIDVAAGEKERNTLEPLLATPPSRTSIVLGKYLAVVTTSMFSAALALASLILPMAIAPQALAADTVDDLAFVIPPDALGLFLLASLLLSGFFSALSIALSVFARSFKEAQVYLSPLSFVLIVPAFLIQFSHPSEVSPLLYGLPIVNNLLLMKGALLGGLSSSAIWLSIFSSLLFIGLGLTLTINLFRQEQVLFRA